MEAGNVFKYKLIELINNKNTNFVIASIYRHSNKGNTTFNDM